MSRPLPAITLLVNDPRLDRAHLDTWLKTMRELPKDRHTTGSMIVNDPDVGHPCFCAMGVGVALARGLDPKTVDIDEARGSYTDALAAIGSTFVSYLIPTAVLSTEEQLNETCFTAITDDDQLTTDVFWEIVNMNDTPGYLSLPKIADEIEACLTPAS